MRIHIPKHFENLGVMKILKDLIEAYILNSPESSVDSYNYYDYNISSSTDPVKRFIEYIYNVTDEDDINGKKRETIINYYTHLLHSLRGSVKVFDILKEMESLIGLKIGSYIYSTEELKIDIEDIKVIDFDLFNKYLFAFFGSLLYYENIKELINKITLDLEIEVSSSFTGNASFVSEYVVTEEYIEES